jgi:citrate lyase subunit beta/citryl-CoA lyase
MKKFSLPLIRSLFFAPANRPELVAKFSRFGADCSVIDLEDGTPEGDKKHGRDLLVDTVRIARDAGLNGMLAVRVNVPGSVHFALDLAAALASDIDAVIIPKLEDYRHTEDVARHFDELNRSSPRKHSRFIIGGIESVKGVMNAATICTRSAGLRAVYFGAEDFAADIGGRRTKEGHEIATARSLVMMAAHAAGVLAIDQAVLDFKNDIAFSDDAHRGRDLGFVGKICIAPAQVKLARAVFTPGEDEVGYANRLVSAFEGAASRGRGTFAFEGKMIDEAVIKQAMAVLAATENVRHED